MILANHGATRAHIIIADDATICVRHAAEELSDYIWKMTGANLTIHNAGRGVIGNTDAAEICVGLTGRPGEPDISGLKNDGYIHKLVGNRLFILSHNDRGTLHAVYAFLEDELGCRFFTDEVEHIPQHSYLAVDHVDKTVIPPFEYREVFGNVVYDQDEYVSKRGLNGLNGMGQTRDAAYGGDIRYYGFVHTFNALVPVDQYFDEHPEYFAMVNGERTRGISDEYHGFARTQLCLTNPDVLKIVIEKTRKNIEEHPDCTIFSISQNDCGNPCDCPECRKVDEEEGSRAGTLIRFVNAVANDIAEDYPNVIIDTLAYTYTRQAPKTKPAPNVAVRICSIECCFSHPLRSCDYQYNGMMDLTKDTDTFQNDIRGWARIHNRMHVWDYVTNFRHYFSPMPNLHVLQDNINFFIENGVTGLFEQGNGEDLSGEFDELRYYILSKLMWEPNGDVDRWMREFMAAYYGMAAQPIREYIDAMTRHVTENNVHVRIFDDPTYHMPDWMIELADRKFDEAEYLADDEEVLERVRKSRIQVKYCKLFNMMHNSAVNDSTYAVACEKFLSEIEHFGFTRVGEWRNNDRMFRELRDRKLVEYT